MNVKADVRSGLRAEGFRFVAGADFLLEATCAQAMDALRDGWGDLPVDPYLPRGATYRRRRHARFLMDHDGGVRHDAAPGYFQSLDVNRLAGGVVRYFASLDGEQVRNHFLRGLMRSNAMLFATCSGAPPAYWTVNVHLVRTTASPGFVGLPSPEGLHRDGFDFIAVHHMSRRNVTGGRTEIRSTDGTLLAHRTFTHPLDSLYADDARVLHDVTPLVWDGHGGGGFRDMLLMSYEAGK
ncbi:2OG-Fe dioxygenase family protein [Streptomyces sp. NPDC020807]|uniref:2OG-Fe dioxygenase family protein n=1 Tax=Streptomyces sp. NPDC020807 TaxID=3155119 RepID=UPI0033F529E4